MVEEMTIDPTLPRHQIEMTLEMGVYAPGSTQELTPRIVTESSAGQEFEKRYFY